MNANAPTLSERDLEEEIRRIHARPHRTLTTAFFGAPTPGLDAVTVGLDGRGPVQFKVVHATCELLVRKALSDAQGAPLALLIDFEGRLPFDVTSRVAGGRIRSVTEERRLARVFGAKNVSADVLASPLKGALLADAAGGYGALSGATLDLETAWRKYLERMVAFPADAPLSEERVTAHCTRADGDPRGFRRVLEARPDLREALHKFLAERGGPVARIAWRAWERSLGHEVAAFAFILQGAREALDESPYFQAWLNLRLADLDPELKGAVTAQRKLLDRWGNLAERLALQFSDEGVLDRVLETAELLLSDDKLKEVLGTSRFLPSALTQGRERLAGAMEAALADPKPKRLADVRTRLEALENHRLRSREPHKRQLDRARMAARLLGYLASLRKVDGQIATDVVAELATAYAREGGFVDWARLVARGTQTDRLDSAIAAVVARVDEIRDEMDERFAQALPSWTAHRKTDRVVPNDEAIDRFVVSFLAGNDHRKLLILLLDGMSWANAVELLLDLEEHRWGPVRWQPKGASGDLLPPMLAALPTLTEVSRAAFFDGRLPAAGESRSTADDPDRFDGHAGLRKLLGHGSRLLMRAEAEDRPGYASRKALDLVAADDRVVAFVINAIDDQLKVGPGLDVAYRVQTLKVLPDLLGAATHAHRAVLLVADHGHVRADRFQMNRPGANALSARARELGPNDQPTPNEIVFDGEGAWRSKNKNRLALLYRETETYGPVHHRGTHGGCSLAEVVTPAVLIAADDLVRTIGVDDKELDLRSFPRPRWWDLEVGVAPVAHPAPPPRKTKAEEKAIAQLTLPQVEAPKPSAPRAPTVSRWAALLRETDIYREAAKREQDFWDTHVIPVVDLLAEHGGAMPDDVFAGRLNLLKFRVPSTVAEVSQRLNLDQHPVLVHDRVQGLVRLQLSLLEQLFTV